MENNFNIKKELFYDVQTYDYSVNCRPILFFISENNHVTLYADGIFRFFNNENDGSDVISKKQFNEILRIRKKMMKIEKNSKRLKELENEK